jgi:beta-galactosidase/beta-glucuronidase
MESSTALPRPEYPRPQFKRKDWINLNGTWSFRYDDRNQGLDEQWYMNPSFDLSITVPFVYTCRLSGIDDQDFHDILWYAKTVTFTDDQLKKRWMLNFGAIGRAHV